MATSRALVKAKPRRPVTRQAATRARNRRLRLREWVRRTLVVSVALGAVTVLGWAAWFWTSGGVVAVASGMGRGVIAITAAMGITLQHVTLNGREKTELKDIQRALAMPRGTPLLSVSLEQIQQRMETLPWVRRASVERMLPSRLEITLEERVPIALWQLQGKLTLVDRDGVSIPSSGIDSYAELPIIVGENAPKRTAELLQTLLSQAELYKRVASAIRVGDRRWNVRFDNGVEVKLPEEGFAEAWDYLAAVDQQQHILARDVRVLDLRIPGKLFVTLSPEGAARRLPPAKGKRT